MSEDSRARACAGVAGVPLSREPRKAAVLSASASHEVLEWFFGINGLPRIERKLAREDKGPLIESEIIAPVGPNLGPNEHKTEPDAA